MATQSALEEQAYMISKEVRVVLNAAGLDDVVPLELPTILASLVKSDLRGYTVIQKDLDYRDGQQIVELHVSRGMT